MSQPRSFTAWTCPSSTWTFGGGTEIWAVDAGTAARGRPALVVSCFQPGPSKGTDIACVLGRAGRPKSTMRGCSKRRRLPTKPRYVTVASVEGTCPLTRRGVSARDRDSTLQKKRAEATHYDAEAKQAQDDQVPECAILPRNRAHRCGRNERGRSLLRADVRTGGHGSQRAGGASGHARWRRWYVGRSRPKQTNTVRLVA